MNDANNRRNKTSPKDFFMHVLSMVALYGSAISCGALVFSMLNRWIPDPLQYDYGSAALSAMRNSISVLVIFFPVYLWVLWSLHKEYASDKSKQNARVRKWLTYFTLFAAGVIVMIDLVTLVNYFLNGEITLRFALKVMTVLAIAGSVFWYYRWDLRKYSIE